MSRYVTFLESAIDGTRFDADQIHTLHEGRPLWVRYDLDQVRAAMTKDTVKRREPSMFRYRELLPVGNLIEPVTLGEGMSPLIDCPRLGAALGVNNLQIKDESQLPTGSFKSRGLAMAITMARHFGVKRLAIPTAGNAGGATAAYAARADMEAYIFMPEDTPLVNQAECVAAGAQTFLVDGLINDCGGLVHRGKPVTNWFDLSTLKEPYRIEGKKTMGLELAEQLGWQLPDVIFYPTGGGTGLIGMWKAFHELKEMGWLVDEKMPRMVSVQSDGCCPIVRAFESGDRFAKPFENARTYASGLRVPVAVGDFMILDAVRQSNGVAIAASEERLAEWQQLAMNRSGVSVCPETAACIGALEQLAESGWVTPDDHVVVFNTGAAQKYFEPKIVEEQWGSHLRRLPLDSEIDFQRLVKDTTT